MNFKRNDKVKNDYLGTFVIIQQSKSSFKYDESLPRFDIKNIETGEIIKDSYLYNGCWETTN